MKFCRNHIVIKYRKGHNGIYMLLTEDLQLYKSPDNGTLLDYDREFLF